MRGIAGILLHRRGQLFHARGRLFECRRLRLGATRQVHVAGGDFTGGLADLFEIAAHVADDRMQVHAQLPQRAQQLADIVLAGGGDDLGQVAAGHDLAGQQRLSDRQHDTLMQHEPEISSRDQRHQRQDRQPGASEAAIKQVVRRQQRQHRQQKHHVRADTCRQRHLRHTAQLCQHARADHRALDNGDTVGIAVLQVAIQGAGVADLLAGGLGTHRHVAGGATVFHHGRDVGEDPVEVAILAAVLDHAGP
ncbi:hypothetical protein IMCC9480_1657 [Oxalobacteraceae bacterium IMCC9480]|nr:hypothetical protein IMCC9480_1657 [Oxalobacteraceae bacterium IMCC9480]